MKKKMLSLLLAASCLTAGCTSGKSQELENSGSKEKYQLETTSSVTAEDCFICGNNPKSLMPYYRQKDSIGIVHWNSGSIMDTEVRTYDEEGKELFEQGSSMKSSGFGENNGTAMINSMPNRGLSEVVVNYKKADEVDFDRLEQKLCQCCLNQVVKFYVDQKNMGKDSCVATTGYCLIDFQTKKIYTLSEPYSMYFIRDYHVNYNIKEDNGGTGDRIELQIFYAPERES